MAAAEQIPNKPGDASPFVRGLFVRVPSAGADELAKELEEMGVNVAYVGFEDDAQAVANFEAFLSACHECGIRVFVDTGPRGEFFEDREGRRLIFCVNGDFTDRWAEYLKKIARLGVDGISVIPDEFRWEQDHVGYEFGGDQWASLGRERFCYCGKCIDKFKDEFKMLPPHEGPGFDVDYYKATITPWVFGTPHRFPSDDDATRNWVRFRYRSVAEAVRYWSESVKEVAPEIATVPMLNMVPIAVDRRYPSGVAWDAIGLLDSVDTLSANPYIGLHPYYDAGLDHYYVSETVKHLLAASSKERATVVLSATSLRPFLRPLRGVEVYGAALSALGHGAQGFAFFHHSMVSKPEQAESREWCRRALGAAKALEPILEGSRVPDDVVVLMSRRAEDYYSLRPGLRTEEERRYGFRALEKVLRLLFQSGCPFRIEYLEHIDYERLRECRVLICPFLYSLSLAEAQDLGEWVGQGHHLLVINQIGETDVLGHPHESPVLLRLLGIRKMSLVTSERPLVFTDDSPFLGGETLPRDGFWLRDFVEPDDETRPLTRDGCITCRRHGEGEVMYLGGEFAIHADQVGYADVLKHAIDYLLDRHRKIAVKKPWGADVEAALRIRDDGTHIVFLVNWDSAMREVQLGLNVERGEFAVRDWLLEPTTDLRLANEYTLHWKQVRKMPVTLPPEAVRVIVVTRET